MTALLYILLEASETGWIAGGGVSAVSILTAVVVLWKRGEATQNALIEVHKTRADEAEKRTMEIVAVLNKNGEAMHAYTDAIKRHADSETHMANATEELAKTQRALAERVADIAKAVNRATGGD